MAGAYVAKPAVSTARVEGVDTPPGWSVHWPLPGDTGLDPDPFFPAPFPPGYEPDYSLSVFGTASIAYNGTASITGTFRDHSTFVTNEPDAIVWTATIASSPSRSINLRFSGDEDYASSISSTCVFGTYWGATPDIQFELTEDDIGGTITLTARSAISGVYVGATLTITVAIIANLTTPFSYTHGDEWNLNLVVTIGIWNPFDSDSYERCSIGGGNLGGGIEAWTYNINYVTEDYPYTSSGTNGYAVITVDENGVTADIRVDELEDNQYVSILLSNLPDNIPPRETTLTTTATLTILGNTYTKIMSGVVSSHTWLRVTNDGTVTVINP